MSIASWMQASKRASDHVVSDLRHDDARRRRESDTRSRPERRQPGTPLRSSVPHCRSALI